MGPNKTLPDAPSWEKGAPREPAAVSGNLAPTGPMIRKKDGRGWGGARHGCVRYTTANSQFTPQYYCFQSDQITSFKKDP